MPGIEPGALRFNEDATPSLWWRIIDQLRPIGNRMVRKSGFAPEPSPSQGEMLLLHHDPDGASGRIRTDDYGFTIPAL